MKGYAETLTVQEGRPLEDFELVAWDGSHKSFEVISLFSHRLRSERQSREGDSAARAIDFSCRSGGCRVAKSPLHIVCSCLSDSWASFRAG